MRHHHLRVAALTALGLSATVGLSTTVALPGQAASPAVRPTPATYTLVPLGGSGPAGTEYVTVLAVNEAGATVSKATTKDGPSVTRLLVRDAAGRLLFSSEPL